jgi:ketosteroid isomerase-like protein
MKKMLVACLGTLLLTACGSGESETKSEAPAPAESTKAAPVEIGDAALMDMGKAGLDNLSKGDIAAWMNSYADNAVYVWNNGDSLAGKKAISDYWTDRRTNVIDSISFTNDVWLPVKVNESQNPAVVATGTWLLGWYMTTAKYKGGGTMTQWIHATMHLNEAGKIDRVIQYLDRVPIMQAMPKK